MKNILVLGSNGMAGHMIAKFLTDKQYNVKTLARTNADFNIDVEKEDISFLNTFDFDYVINCIGLLISDSEQFPDRAVYLNSYFPHRLETIFRNSKTKIIQISTDCVFDGLRGNYSEYEFPNEKHIYGKSKALGELDNNKDITFRVSIIGPEIKNRNKRSGLLNWIITNENAEINGWSNVFWSGITTLQLAKCIQQYIQNPIFAGIHHLKNESIDKFTLLKKINDVFELNKIIVSTKADKFTNKILLDNKKCFKVSDYNTQLIELRNFMEKNAWLYHY